MLFASACLFFVASVLFVQTLFVTPHLELPPSVRQMKSELISLQQQPTAQNPVKFSFLEKYQQLKKNKPSTPRPKRQPREGIRLGYYVSWDEDSFQSLKHNAAALTHIAPEWFSMQYDGTLLRRPDERVKKFAEEKGLTLIPLLTNLTDSGWQPEAVENLANGSLEKQMLFIGQLLFRLDRAHAQGVLIDWQQLDPSYKDQYTQFIAHMAEAFHREHKEVWLSVPVGQELEAFDLDALPDIVDHFVAQLYDENGENDTPGPIASQNWFEGWLHVMMGYGEPSQWIIGLGLHGYDWASNRTEAETIGFTDAMARAKHSNIKNLAVEGPDYNPHFSYLDDKIQHTVWFLDAVTFLNQLRSSEAEGVGGFAFVRLGLEDDSIWPALKLLKTPALKPDQFKTLSVLPSINHIGEVGRGQFVTADLNNEDGSRNLSLDKFNRVTSSYSKLPEYLTLFREGAASAHEVAITFDDGPDPKWTPKILDILKRNKIKAAFFLVGKQAEQYPDLVNRILAEGHEIGNHTYTHPNTGQVTREQVRLELNATQRLLEAITGRSTTLFRPPYNADAKPQDKDELIPLEIAQQLNYITVLENIDPEDWARPGVDEIVRRVKEQRRDGDIILLHDAGGDRSQTVAALPRIIDYLRSRGDQIIPLSQLVGIPPEQLMPPVSDKRDRVTHMISNIGFGVYHNVTQAMIAFMLVATGLVVVRTLIVIALAAEHRRRTEKYILPTFAPPISVIIAAYNEGKVIAETLDSVLRTNYTGAIDVIVIDDGSKDDTAARVEAASLADPRIRLLRQTNQGKAIALRNGMTAAKHDIFVLLDADTHFQANTIPHLVAPLRDEKVGAVSGHAKVGNTRNFITRCQALEYVCGFNLDRRAYAIWNCITVAPGAVSALHRKAVEAAGGIQDDTLAEDTDLTLAMHRTHYKIEYTHRAVAWTEAPENVRNLVKQRSRWAFGTLQCLWKHRDLVLDLDHPALGWFSLPSLWFFQIVLVAIAPIIDIVLILSLITGATPQIWTYVLLFLLMDLLLAVLACWMEKEPLSHSWRIIPMRLFYRPLLSWVVWKAIIRALRGALVGWSKLERTASVHVPQTSTEHS